MTSHATPPPPRPDRDPTASAPALGEVLDEVTRNAVRFLCEANERLEPVALGRDHFLRVLGEAAAVARREARADLAAVYDAIGAWVRAAGSFLDAGIRFADAVTALPDRLADVDALLVSLLGADSPFRPGQPRRGHFVPMAPGDGSGPGA